MNTPKIYFKHFWVWVVVSWWTIEREITSKKSTNFVSQFGILYINLQVFGYTIFRPSAPLTHFQPQTYCFAVNCSTLPNRTQNTWSNWRNCYFDTNLQVFNVFSVEQLLCLQSLLNSSFTHSLTQSVRCDFFLLFLYFYFASYIFIVICYVAYRRGCIASEIHIVTIHLLHLYLRMYFDPTQISIYVY